MTATNVDLDEVEEPIHSERTELLREANEKLIVATIHSHELAEEAERAKTHAEKAARDLEETERELRLEAKFRERLIGIVGHDLRNPLTAITMIADYLSRREDVDVQTAQAADRIKTIARRMAEMIKELLDFTRAHVGGGLPLRPKPVNLEAVCRPVIEELEIGHAPSAKFVCEFSGDLNGCWDAERLAEVISNLSGNAVEHGAAGAPISIKVKDEGETVSVAVSNLGEPIPPDALPFIFDPFRQGTGDQLRMTGLGLGLYISQQIVLAHRGAIEVTSTKDQGTTFTVRLPRAVR